MDTIRQNWVIEAIRALLCAGVLTQEEAQKEVDILRNYGGFGVYATIAGTEYNITGMARGPYILQIEEGEEANIVNMETIEEFKEWVKDRLAAASTSVADQ
jgi:ATP-dependent helicase/DNAse subunit B